MGANSGALLHEAEVNALCEETGFSARQINRLFQRFKHLDKRDCGQLTKEDLLSIPEVNINPLGERLIDVMIEDYGSNDEEHSINFKEFVRVLATFKSTGRKRTNTGGGGAFLNNNSSMICTKKSKLRFLFSLYDRNHDNKIDKDELVDILKMMVGGNIEETLVESIASQTISELDKNGDRAITFDEFCATLNRIDLDSRMSMKFLC